MIFKTKGFTYEIAEDGRNAAFLDLEGKDRLAPSSASFFTDNDMVVHPAISASFDGELITYTYETGLVARVRVTAREDYLIFTLAEVSSEDFFSIAFLNVDMNFNCDDYLPGGDPGRFSAALMGLTVSTHMAEHPGRNIHLSAAGYPHIGLFKTARRNNPVSAVLLGGDDGEMRRVMQRVIECEMPDGELPKSKNGGPYAFDNPENQDTYITTGSIIRPEDVPVMAENFRSIGVKQIGFHQGQMYRQGDYQPSATHYPRGMEDFKKVIDAFHKEGFKIGVHCYTFFLHQASCFMTPVPSEDLDFIIKTTLAKPLTESDTEVFVESVEGAAPEYNYSLVSSPLIKVGHELIRFDKVDFERNCFTGCVRGAYNTVVSSHEAGETLTQLKEYFGYVLPKAGSELFYDIARRTAEFYNEGDFDGFYLDAIDGVFALEGNEYAWYHAMDFVSEMFQYLKKPPIFDCCYNPQYTASWYARSRYGALDRGVRAHRHYIDEHLAYDRRTAGRMYLTPELGWYDIYNEPSALYDQIGRQMTDEDIEYLGSKIVGEMACMSYQSQNVSKFSCPRLKELAEVLLKYDRLRYSPQNTEALRARLRVVDALFRTEEQADGSFEIFPLKDRRYRLDDLEKRGEVHFENPYAAQAPKIRIEALYAADEASLSEVVPLPEERSANATNNFYSPGPLLSQEEAMAASAKSAMLLHRFDESAPLETDTFYPLNRQEVDGRSGVLFTVIGDGSGTMLRLRFESSLNGTLKNQISYFVKCDFVGERTFAFYEAQEGDPDRSEWAPQELHYRVFRDVSTFYSHYGPHIGVFPKMDGFRISLNRENTGIRLVSLYLTPIKATSLENPTVSGAGGSIRFPVTLMPGEHLEYTPGEREATVKAQNGTVRTTVCPEGKITLAEGGNAVTLTSDSRGENLRAALTLCVRGEGFR